MASFVESKEDWLLELYGGLTGESSVDARKRFWYQDLECDEHAQENRQECGKSKSSRPRFDTFVNQTAEELSSDPNDGSNVAQTHVQFADRIATEDPVGSSYIYGFLVNDSEEKCATDPIQSGKKIETVDLVCQMPNNTNVNASGTDLSSEENCDAFSKFKDVSETELVAAGNGDIAEEAQTPEKQPRRKSIMAAFKGGNKTKRNAKADVARDEDLTPVEEHVGSRQRRWSLFTKNKKKIDSEHEDEPLQIEELAASPGSSRKNSRVGTPSSSSLGKVQSDESGGTNSGTAIDKETDEDPSEDPGENASEEAVKSLGSSESHLPESAPSSTKKRMSLKRLANLRPKHKKSASEETNIQSDESMKHLNDSSSSSDAVCKTQELPNEGQSTPRLSKVSGMEVDVSAAKSHETGKPPDISGKQKKRRGSWFKTKQDCAVQKNDDEKVVQEVRLKTLQSKLADLGEEYMKANDKIKEEIVEKTEALEKAKLDKRMMETMLNEEIDKLKAEIDERQQELHVCSSTRDVLHITAVETSKELEEAEEILCKLKKSNEDLQYDSQEDKLFIAQLKIQLAEKEDECKNYKKLMLENQKCASRTIAGYLSQANETLKKPSEISKKKGSSIVEEDVIKNLKLEKNRFAEQVELLSSYNISLEMQHDDLQRQLKDAIKLIRLYECVGIHLKLNDVRYKDLSREAQQLLAFYRACDGSKNIIKRCVKQDDTCNADRDESLGSLIEACACEPRDPNVHSGLAVCRPPVTSRMTNNESLGNLRQRAPPRRRSHQGIEQLSTLEGSAPSVDLNVTSNNAGDRTSERNPLHRTTAANDIRHEISPPKENTSGKTPFVPSPS